MYHIVKIKGLEMPITFRSENAYHDSYLVTMPGVEWVQTISPTGYVTQHGVESDNLRRSVKPLTPEVDNPNEWM